MSFILHHTQNETSPVLYAVDLHTVWSTCGLVKVVATTPLHRVDNEIRHRAHVLKLAQHPLPDPCGRQKLPCADGRGHRERLHCEFGSPIREITRLPFTHIDTCARSYVTSIFGICLGWYAMHGEMESNQNDMFGIGIVPKVAL